GTARFAAASSHDRGVFLTRGGRCAASLPSIRGRADSGPRVIGSSEHPALTFGFPPDAAAWAALVLGIVCLFFPRWPLLGKAATLSLKRATFLLASLCLVSFCLSWGYFYFYLGGAPRIIDATTYLLEARSFAAGSFSFEVPE